MYICLWFVYLALFFRNVLMRVCHWKMILAFRVYQLLCKLRMWDVSDWVVSSYPLTSFKEGFCQGVWSYILMSWQPAPLDQVFKLSTSFVTLRWINIDWHFNSPKPSEFSAQSVNQLKHLSSVLNLRCETNCQKTRWTASRLQICSSVQTLLNISLSGRWHIIPTLRPDNS